MRDKTHPFARAFAALCLACALAISLPEAARAYTADFFVTDASKDGLYMEMAIQPQAVHRDGKTFLVIQGRDLEPHAVVYDHDSDVWVGPVRVGDNPLTNDMHGAPALVIDSSGHLHVFYGGHHSPLKHARSAAPLDVTRWVELPDVAPSFTYPQPVILPNGTIDLFYRDGGPGLRWVYRRTTNGGATWSAPVTVLEASSSTGYYAHFASGPGAEVFVSFVRLSWDSYFTGTKWARHDVHLIRRDEGGVWRTAAGSALSMPLTPSSLASCRLHDSGSANTNMTLSRPGPGGLPRVLFSTGSGAGPDSYAWKLARWTGSAWDIREIARTDHFFDSGTFVQDGDRIDAYLVVAGTRGEGTGDRDYTDDGGLVVRFVSEDDGVTWVRDPEPISPSVPEAIYNNPQSVSGAHADARVAFSEWVSGPSIHALRLYLWGDSGLIGREFDPVVRRTSGSDRIDTAVRASREAFPDGAESVVLANSDDFPDALTGAPLAFALKGPVLLTPTGSLPTAVRSEIDRLGPKRVVVLGGARAISASTASAAMRSAGLGSYERIGGSDRYDTAARVARRLAAATGSAPGTAVIVTGANYPDALSVAPLASWRGYPILLVRGSYFPPRTADALRDLGVTSTLIAGQDDVVGTPVERLLPSPTRIAGHDRYETSAALAEHSLTDGLLPGRAVVVTGRDFPDALCASVLSARLRAPLVLVPGTSVGHHAEAYFDAHAGSVFETRIVGGTRAVTTQVGAAIVTLMRQ